MSTEELGDSSESLALDKIEQLPGNTSPPESDPAPASASLQKAPETDSPPLRPPKRRWVLWGSCAAALLTAGLLVTGLLIFYAPQPPAPVKPALPPDHDILSIGPVYADVGTNDRLELSLNIHFFPDADTSLGKRRTEIQRQIKSALETPRARELINARNFEELRRYIKADLNAFLGYDAVEKIYFSNFIIF